MSFEQRATQGGRAFLPDGTPWSWAEWEHLTRDYSLAWNIVHGNATLLTKRCAVSTTDYHYGLSVPESKRIVIFDRSITMGEGAYNVDVIDAAGGFTGGTAAFKRPLDTTNGPVASNLFCGITPSGTITVVEEGRVDAGDSPGAARTAGAFERDSYFTIIPSGSTKLVRVTRQQAVNYTINIRLVAWEEDA